MWTRNSSLTLACEAPVHQLRTVAELETTSGRYYLSADPFSWSGNLYQARVTNAGNVVVALGGTANASPVAKTLTVDVANPDGFFSTKPPEWSRHQILTYRQLFPDVNSALASYAFVITGGQMAAGGAQYRIEAEDPMTRHRRKPVPRNEVIITRSMYPEIGDNFAGLNRPIPLIFGRSLTPCYLVDVVSLDTYVACVGSATWGATSIFYDLHDGGFSPIVGNGQEAHPYSLTYAMRGGVPVTEICVTSGIPLDNHGGLRWADLIMPAGSEDCTPDRVLVEMLTNKYYGVCFDPTFIDSDSLLAANAWFRTNSVFFDGGFYEQRPLDEWLGAWQHDSTARLKFQDKLQILIQQSASPVYSFYTGNIQAGTLAMEDISIVEEESRRTVIFRDRTKDAGIPSVTLDDKGVEGQSRVAYFVGCGADSTVVTPFIGRPTVASRAAQRWALENFYGIRRYGLTSTVRAGHLEEGDPVSMTHSLIGASSQYCMVSAVNRRPDALFDFTLQHASNSMFAFSPQSGGDPQFLRRFQFVPYNAGSYFIYASADFGQPTFQIVVVSHQLDGSPLWFRARIDNYWAGFALHTELLQSYGTNWSNDSQFVAYTTFQSQVQENLALNIQDYLQGWYLYSFI